VLAHELSHHLGLHTLALTVGHWLSLPIVALARIGFFLQNVARAATESFVQHSAALTALGRVIAGLLTGISWLFLAVLHASDAVGNLVGHQAEYEADRRAIDLGHGPELAAALRRLIQLGGGRRAIGFRARLGASHPAARTRVARIEALLRHPTMR
jgi:Zn-dependent protease with chaperone function